MWLCSCCWCVFRHLKWNTSLKKIFEAAYTLIFFHAVQYLIIKTHNPFQLMSPGISQVRMTLSIISGNNQTPFHTGITTMDIVMCESLRESLDLLLQFHHKQPNSHKSQSRTAVWHNFSEFHSFSNARLHFKDDETEFLFLWPWKLLESMQFFR